MTFQAGVARNPNGRSKGTGHMMGDAFDYREEVRKKYNSIIIFRFSHADL